MALHADQLDDKTLSGRAAVFLSGSFTPPTSSPDLDSQDPRSPDWLLSFDWILAADGGLDHLMKLQVLPDVFLGDMDSVSAEALSWAENAGVKAEVYPRAKDMTDGELVIRRALDYSPQEIWLFGVTGPSRPDHFLGNIHYTLAMTRQTGTDFYLSDGLGLICPLVGPVEKTIRIPAFVPKESVENLRISLIPVTDLTHVSCTGLRYPLNDESLPAGSTRAISNELPGEGSAEQKFTIRVESGDLLLVLAKEAPIQ